MKRHMNLLFYPIFTISYACLLGLGMECMLRLLGVSMAISLDGATATRYPRLLPVLCVVGLLALVALILLTVLNLRLSPKMHYSKRILAIQAICAFCLSIPMIKAWDVAFTLLQVAF